MSQNFLFLVGDPQQIHVFLTALFGLLNIAEQDELQKLFIFLRE